MSVNITVASVRSGSGRVRAGDKSSISSIRRSSTSDRTPGANGRRPEARHTSPPRCAGLVRAIVATASPGAIPERMGPALRARRLTRRDAISRIRLMIVRGFRQLHGEGTRPLAIFLAESLANEFSEGEDSPELREKDRILRIFTDVGVEGSNPLCSTIQSLSFRTSRRIDRNPRVCARFAIIHGPREPPRRPESAESSKTYPGAIWLPRNSVGGLGRDFS
jgi:hypothetical protein